MSMLSAAMWALLQGKKESALRLAAQLSGRTPSLKCLKVFRMLTKTSENLDDVDGKDEMFDSQIDEEIERCDDLATIAMLYLSLKMSLPGNKGKGQGKALYRLTLRLRSLLGSLDERKGKLIDDETYDAAVDSLQVIGYQVIGMRMSAIETIETINMSDAPTITIGSKAHRPTTAKTQGEINANLRSGGSAGDRKMGQANKGHQGTDHQKIVKLDRENEVAPPPKISLGVGKAIMQGRQATGLTQKDLATRISEKPSVVQDYEQSKATPNPQILGKLERILKIKLRGKDIGAPLGGSTTGSIPPPLVGPSMTIVNDQLYLIGGRKVTERVMTNNVYKLDLHTLRWNLIQFDDSSQIPSERYFHSVDLWNDNLVLFGGMAYKDNDELAVLDDVFFLNLKSLSWIKIDTSLSPSYTKSNGPMPRYAHLSSISGDCLIIAGGQGKDNQYIQEIAILDLRSTQWLHTRAYDHQCGSYRSVAVSSPQRVVSPDPSTIRVGGEILHLLPYTDNCSEFDPSDVYIYSNYNFQDLKRQLEVLEAPSNTEFSVADHSGLMRGASLPPGLRFPTGSILGNHLVISGTYLANTSQTFSIWALDLSSFVWQRIDPGAHLSSGSWNKGTLWRDTNRYVVMGNRDRSLVNDYNHRQQNFDHVSFVELEAFGIYQPPPVTLSLDAQLLGLQSLVDESLADFDLIPEGTNEADREKYRFPCSSRILEARWPWFRARKLAYNQQLHAQNPSSVAEQRLLSKTLTIPESPTVVKALLEWFYTSALVTPLQLAQPVLASLLGFSRTYGLEPLERNVKHAMHVELEPATAVQIHEAATLCGARMLQIRALKMVMSSNKRTAQQPFNTTGGPGSGDDSETRFAQFGTNTGPGLGSASQLHTSNSTSQFTSNGNQYGRQRSYDVEDGQEDPSIHLANMLSKFATVDEANYTAEGVAKQPHAVERPTSPNADPKRVSRIINLPSVMNLHDVANGGMEHNVVENPPEVPARPSLSPPTVTTNQTIRNRRQGAMLTPNDYSLRNNQKPIPQSAIPSPQASIPSPHSMSPPLTSPMVSRVGSVGSVNKARTSPLFRSPNLSVMQDDSVYSPSASPRPFANNYNYSPHATESAISTDNSRAPSRQGGSVGLGLGIHDISHSQGMPGIQNTQLTQGTQGMHNTQVTQSPPGSQGSPGLSVSTYPQTDSPSTPQDFELLSASSWHQNDEKVSEQATSSTTSFDRTRSYSQFSSTSPSIAATSVTTSAASSNGSANVNNSKRGKLFSKFKSSGKEAKNSKGIREGRESSETRTKSKTSREELYKTNSKDTPSLHSSQSSSQNSANSSYYSQEGKDARKVRKEKEKTMQRQRVEAQRLKAMKRDGKLRPVLGEPAPAKKKASEFDAWGSFCY
ncbi:hypothetical protein E3P89_03802 [Wallemia ichthyophaga]|nr:hypothetical protein E3P89_03802 [Wallemia ichthyophaga]